MLSAGGYPVELGARKRLPPILAEVALLFAWLGEADEAASLLNVVQAEFEYWQVDKRVGSVRNNDAGLIKPLS